MSAEVAMERRATTSSVTSDKDADFRSMSNLMASLHLRRKKKICHDKCPAVIGEAFALQRFKCCHRNQEILSENLGKDKDVVRSEFIGVRS